MSLAAVLISRARRRQFDGMTPCPRAARLLPSRLARLSPIRKITCHILIIIIDNQCDISIFETWLSDCDQPGERLSLRSTVNESGVK
jgi:hypothetical protein